MIQWAGGEPKLMALARASTTRANVPSTSSRIPGRSCTTRASPITNGATVTTPIASEANQFSQVVRIGASEPCNRMKPAVPPSPEIAVPTAVARKRPSTRRELSRLNTEPKWYSISHAMIMASPALHRANTIALPTFRSPNRLAVTVAATTPTATGNRAPGPSAINNPEAIPAAGQNTATPSGSVSSARLNRAARK